MFSLSTSILGIYFFNQCFFLTSTKKRHIRNKNQYLCWITTSFSSESFRIIKYLLYIYIYFLYSKYIYI